MFWIFYQLYWSLQPPLARILLWLRYFGIPFWKMIVVSIHSSLFLLSISYVFVSFSLRWYIMYREWTLSNSLVLTKSNKDQRMMEQIWESALAKITWARPRWSSENGSCARDREERGQIWEEEAEHVVHLSPETAPHFPILILDPIGPDTEALYVVWEPANQLFLALAAQHDSTAPNPEHLDQFSFFSISPLINYWHFFFV